MNPQTVTLTVELTRCQAAALKRLCDKFSHTAALAYLYPHVAVEIRSEQAYDMVRATAFLDKALEDAGVHHYPWIETREV